MKRILNNFKLLLVVVTVLVIFNIFVTGSAVSKYLLATKFAIWNVQRNNKFTFGTSFAQLYGDEFNPFKEITFLDDDGEAIEKQADKQAEQSQGQSTSSSSSSEEFNKMVDTIEKRFVNAPFSFKRNAAIAYTIMLRDWDNYKIAKTFPKSHEAISGIMGNIAGESGGNVCTIETGSGGSNRSKYLSFSKLSTWGDWKEFLTVAKRVNGNKNTSIGGTGLFGFTSTSFMDPLLKVTNETMKKYGFKDSDIVDGPIMTEMQINYTMNKSVEFTGFNDIQEELWSHLVYDFPSSYSGSGNNRVVNPSTPIYEQVSDLWSYAWERNFFTTDATVDEKTNGKSPYAGTMSQNNKWRQMASKQVYEAVKDLPLNISSGAGSSSQSNVTPTIGQGNSIWIMGDSRTHQLITYLDSKLKSSKEGATRSLAQWSKTGTSPTYAKYKITENGKTIELNIFGIGSMGFKSSLGGNSSSGETAQYKDYLAQVGYINNVNNVIFLWFGVNGDTPSNYRGMCKDIYGNVPMFQFSVPAGLSQWGTPNVIPFDSKNSILLKEFKDNYIDVCGGDPAFTYNGSDVSTFKTLGNGKYAGGSDFLHFKIPGGYDILWPNIKKGIFDRIK